MVIILYHSYFLTLKVAEMKLKNEQHRAGSGQVILAKRDIKFHICDFCLIFLKDGSYKAKLGGNKTSNNILTDSTYFF